MYLPSGLVLRLATHQLQSRYSAPTEYVFATSKGTAHGHRNLSKRLLERLCKRARIPEPYPTAHHLRHTYAAAYIAAGGDVVTHSADLGHASPDITMRIYMHEFDKAKRRDEHRQRVDVMYEGARKDSALNAGDNAGSQTATARLAKIPRGLHLD